MKVIIHTKKIFLSGVILSFVFLPLCGLAAGGNWIAGPIVPCGTSNSPGPCTLCHLVVGFYNLFKWGLALLFTACILFITVAGVIYMVSSGNKALMDWAKKALLYSLTAFVLFLCSWLIVTAVMIALGYKQVNNWWTFTCDETSLSSTGAGMADRREQTLSGMTPNLTGKGCAGVVQNALAMVGMGYSQSNRMGPNTADCSSVAYRSYKAAGCNLPLGNSDTYLGLGKDFNVSQQSSLKAGDLLVYQGHVATCLDDGCTQVIGANSRRGIYTKDSGYDIKRATKVIQASDYCPDC